MISSPYEITYVTDYHPTPPPADLTAETRVVTYQEKKNLGKKVVLSNASIKEMLTLSQT